MTARTKGQAARLALLRITGFGSPGDSSRIYFFLFLPCLGA
jgi:hypothetical protein